MTFNEYKAAKLCLDGAGTDYWTCIEFDGTGLWCDKCIKFWEQLNESN